MSRTRTQLIAGIQPEGSVTRAHCESAGTMNLMQNGVTFSGVATQLAIVCETKGGQQFQPPGAFLPMAVEDGRIRGASIAFSFNSITVTPCPQHGIIAAIAAGVATELKAGGRCFVPGHPLSESPVVLLPPPGGTSKTLSWRAVRP